MKISELDRSLCGKLKLRAKEAHRHSDYRLVLGNNAIPLPTLLRVSRGSGELTGKNLGGVAKGLGLNEYGVAEMVNCHIGRACVLLCLCGRLLQFSYQVRQEQGELFRPGLTAMLDSVEILLAEPDHEQSAEWSAAERKMLNRLREHMTLMFTDAELGPFARRIADRSQTA